MTEVVCVKVGNKYPDEYVINLYNGVKRHLKQPYRFSCITDKPIEGLDINWITCPPELEGWWAKMYIFSKDNGLEGNIFYLDLDQVIIGGLDKFIEQADPNSLTMIQDFIRVANHNTTVANSSVMFFPKDSFLDLWDDFTMWRAQIFDGGDQEYIYSYAKKRIKYWPTSWVKSWKWEVLNGGICGFYYNQAPIYRNKEADLTNTSILCFHGDPKPHEIPEMTSIWKGENNGG